MENNDVLKEVSINTLVITKNSRWRVDNANLGELIESIKQHGILQPIVARKEDNVVICGNRRLASAKILDFTTVPVLFKEGVTNKDLLILNLIENMQRKDINSIEIGMQCYEILQNQEFKIGVNELSARLGYATSRINACLGAYKSLPEEFRKYLVHSSGAERKFGELPESVVFAILNFSRFWKPISDEELKLILNIAKDEKLSVIQINLLGQLVLGGMKLKNALKELNNYKVHRVNIIALKSELVHVMNKEREVSAISFFKKVIKEQYPNMIF